MPKIDQVKEQLYAAGLGKTEMWRAGKELIVLANALSDTEIIEAAVAGEYEDQNGFAVATADRVLFASGGLFKNHTESILYDKISSVQADKSRIVIQASGNSATIEKIVRPQLVVPFANYVRAKLNAGPKMTAVDASVADDIPSQIEKLARLRDQGILSDEEFQAQKLKLLERM